MSDLKDVNLVVEPKQTSKPLQMKTLDNFFFAKVNQSEQMNHNCESVVDSSDSFAAVCPKCEMYIECNNDFYYQHLDSCL